MPLLCIWDIWLLYNQDVVYLMNMNKGNKLALIYDFDKTLSPRDMQEFHLIPSLGYDNVYDFWDECSKFSQANNCDPILSYMHQIVADNPDITKQQLLAEGKYIDLYEGVDTWFERINNYGLAHDINIEHYIISSGLKDMIEGTSIAKYFRYIYACCYAYDDAGKILWPSRVVNYTMKTQYLFRINKGVLLETNDDDLNRSTPEEDKQISIEDMIYFGDGITDVPSMKVVSQNGGYTIAVYAKQNDSIAKELQLHKRANFALEADYSANSDIEKILMAIIDAKQAMNKLKDY